MQIWRPSVHQLISLRDTATDRKDWFYYNKLINTFNNNNATTVSHEEHQTVRLQPWTWRSQQDHCWIIDWRDDSQTNEEHRRNTQTNNRPHSRILKRLTLSKLNPMNKLLIIILTITGFIVLTNPATAIVFSSLFCMYFYGLGFYGLYNNRKHHTN